MKQKLKRFMAGFMAMLTLVGTLFTNGTTAFAASPQANIAFWNASVKNSGEVSELKPGYNHGKILYSILDGNSAYCMNFGLRADGGQLMNSYDDASTSMSAQQRKLLSYCLYYGFNSTQKIHIYKVDKESGKAVAQGDANPLPAYMLTSSQNVPILTNERNTLATIANRRRIILASPKTSFKAPRIILNIHLSISKITVPTAPITLLIIISLLSTSIPLQVLQHLHRP